MNEIFRLSRLLEEAFTNGKYEEAYKLSIKLEHAVDVVQNRAYALMTNSA
jgi:hypothetical protein